MSHTDSTGETLPRHVAIIMDGNGRWAEERGLPRALGHHAGAETVRRTTTFARKRGIPFLTLYAFSTENWSRPRDEVEALMRLLGEYIDSELATMLDNEVRLRIIGDTAGLSPSLREKLAEACDRTSTQCGLVLTLAINYGGRDEILRAARAAAGQLIREGRAAGSLDEKTFARFLDTCGLPDPDLILRTAGEMRLSNFLIWQAAYAELLFVDTAWPDFSDRDFEDALTEYGKRVRKFGGR